MNGAGPSCGYYNDALPNASLRELAIDGNHVLWGVDNFNGTIHSCQTATSGGKSNFYMLNPCVSTAAAACTTSSLSVTSGGDGGILQFIGAATPTWPVLSYLKPGLMPSYGLTLEIGDCVPLLGMQWPPKRPDDATTFPL